MKKKICFIVSTPYTAKAFLENHFEKLSDFYEVHLVANLKENDLPDYHHPKLDSIKHIAIERKISIIQDVFALWEAIKYFKQKRFDAVVCFTPKAGLIGITASKISGVRNRIHFFTGQVWHTKTGMFKIFLKLLDKWVVALSTKIIVDGKPQQEYLIDNHIITPQNSITLGKGTISGINVKKFEPNPQIRCQQRSELGYLENDIVFLFLGRLNEDKGVLDLAKAFQQLEKQHVNVKLLLVGPDEESIQSKINELGYNSESIHFYGNTNQPEKMFQLADVFCLPSHREAFGLSIIEASACELPVICSDTYGLKDSMVDEVTGIRHSTHNVKSIVHAMEILHLNKEKRYQLGKNGREYVLNNFSKDTITDLWFDYLKSIIQ